MCVRIYSAHTGGRRGGALMELLRNFVVTLGREYGSGGKAIAEAAGRELGVRVFDCSGLIKGFLWTDEHGTIEYNRSQDLSASRFYEMSPCKGEINTMPDIKGLLVFAINHMGVYIGGGLVIEALGHSAGIIQTQLKSRPWTHWGYCPFIEY